MMCWYIAAVNRDPKKKMPPPDKFWPLPGDSSFDNTPPEDRLKKLKDRTIKAQQLIKQINGRRSQDKPRS